MQNTNLIINKNKIISIIKNNKRLSILLLVAIALSIANVLLYLYNDFYYTFNEINIWAGTWDANLTFTFHNQNEYGQFFNKTIKAIENSFLTLSSEYDFCSGSIFQLPYIITNKHCSKFNTAEFLNGYKSPVEFISQSPNDDIAFYKLTGNITDFLKNLPKLVFNSNPLKKGSEVFAISNPCDSRHLTLRLGKITSIEKDTLLHSSVLLPGDSGGLLFNRFGEIIGINNASRYKKGVHQKLCSFFSQSFDKISNTLYTNQTILACPSHKGSSLAIPVQNILKSLRNNLPQINLTNINFSNAISTSSNELSNLCKK